MIGNQKFENMFRQWLLNNTVLAEVHTMNPNLMLVGVTILEVHSDYIVFSEAGSAGAARVFVKIDHIVAVELA